MRIFNGSNSQIDLPLSGKLRITTNPKSISTSFLPSDDFLDLLVKNYDETEVAIVVDGICELNLCAKHPPVSPLVVQSLEEAISRFSEKKSSGSCKDKKGESPVKKSCKKDEKCCGDCKTSSILKEAESKKDESAK